MDCPVCGVALQRSEYENAIVFQCGECAGYLVPKRRLVLIKTSRIRSPDLLKQEAAAEQRPESEKVVRCPRCRAAQMQKELVCIGEEGEFSLDVCSDCDYVWFDGGELARWQIDHEQGAQSREAEQMRRRAETRTAEQQAELDQRIAALPHSPTFLAHARRELILLAILLLLVMGTLFFLVFNFRPVWSGGLSVLLAAYVGWLLLQTLDTTRSQIVSLVVLATVEIIYLIYLVYLMFGS